MSTSSTSVFGSTPTAAIRSPMTPQLFTCGHVACGPCGPCGLFGHMAVCHMSLVSSVACVRVHRPRQKRLMTRRRGGRHSRTRSLSQCHVARRCSLDLFAMASPGVIHVHESQLTAFCSHLLRCGTDLITPTRTPHQPTYQTNHTCLTCLLHTISVKMPELWLVYSALARCRLVRA